MDTEEFFAFSFPLKEEEATKSVSPLLVKDIALDYVVKQNDVRGDLCLVRDKHNNVVAVAYCDNNLKGHFYVEASASLPELIEE